MDFLMRQQALIFPFNQFLIEKHLCSSAKESTKGICGGIAAPQVFYFCFSFFSPFLIFLFFELVDRYLVLKRNR